MAYRLHNITSFEPIGSTVYHYGYKCEVREDGAVWAEIPKELYELELSVGRIRGESKKVAEPVKPAAPIVKLEKEPEKEPEAPVQKAEIVPIPKVGVEPEKEPEKVEEVIVAQPAVVEDTVKVEVAPVKIDGRSKAAKQNKR